jgi:hypothetical protein
MVASGLAFASATLAPAAIPSPPPDMVTEPGGCGPWPSAVPTLPGVEGGAALEWGDYDSDGDLDILLSGAVMPSFTRITRIYRSSGGGSPTFTDIGAGLPGISFGDLAWGDCDSDGDLDMVMAGVIAPGDEDIARLYRNEGGVNPAFTDALVGLPPVNYCSLAWGDYDNDGDLDLLLSGQGSTLLTRVYRNGGGPTSTFTDIGAGLPGMYLCSVAWGDYDNDGDLDILLTGDTDDPVVWTGISRIYRNSGGPNPTFTDAGAGLLGAFAGRVTWADYDNDGDLDLLLTGQESAPSFAPVVRLYRNGGGPDPTFTHVAVGLPTLGVSAVAWGDYDNDGYLDLAISGTTPTLEKTVRVYRNGGGADPGFSDIGATPEAIAASDIAWGDFDQDGDLDLLLAGQASGGAATRVFRNDCAPPNEVPAAPTNLSATGSATRTLGWDAATDAETPSASLTYNLRVGTSPGAGDLFSGMVDPATGRRRIAARGNTDHRTSWTLHLPAGIPVYWSVQAVDGAFAGSPFAPEVTLDVGQDPAPAHGRITAEPNPFALGTLLRFDLPRPGRATLAIHDVSGRRVRALLDRELPSGPNVSTWDARDDQGRPVPAGVYLVRLRAGGIERTTRIDRVR